MTSPIPPHQQRDPLREQIDHIAQKIGSKAYAAARIHSGWEQHEEVDELERLITQQVDDVLAAAEGGLPPYAEFTDKDRRVDEYWKEGRNKAIDQAHKHLQTLRREHDVNGKESSSPAAPDVEQG